MTVALHRHQGALILLGLGATSLVFGVAVAHNEHAVMLLAFTVIAICGIAAMLTMLPSTLFLGWLFLAPLFQVAAQESAVGRPLVWALYTAPAVMFVVLTLTRRSSASIAFVDVFPAAFVTFVFASILLTSDAFRTNPAGTLRSVFMIVALGIVVYYFLVHGPGASIAPEKVCLALLAGAVLQGALALVDLTTGWNPWGETSWQLVSGPARAVATLANPGVLGAYLGVGIVIAVAVLGFDGPTSLRRPSILVLLIATPGLFATLTRGPIIATTLAVAVLLVLGRMRLLGLTLIATTAIVIIALLPSIRASDLYQERVAERANIELRSNLEQISVDLWKQKPVLGWGFGSYDRVKNTAEFVAVGVPLSWVRAYTSHNTYLTMLVELGGLGFLLYALPFGILGLRGLARARAPSPDRWLLVGSLAALAVIVLTASTLDFRFFSIALMLPWVFLALLRRATDPSQMAATQHVRSSADPGE